MWRRVIQLKFSVLIPLVWILSIATGRAHAALPYPFADYLEMSGSAIATEEKMNTRSKDLKKTFQFSNFTEGNIDPTAMFYGLVGGSLKVSMDKFRMSEVAVIDISKGIGRFTGNTELGPSASLICLEGRVQSPKCNITQEGTLTIGTNPDSRIFLSSNTVFDNQGTAEIHGALHLYDCSSIKIHAGGSLTSHARSRISLFPLVEIEIVNEGQLTIAEGVYVEIEKYDVPPNYPTSITIERKKTDHEYAFISTSYISFTVKGKDRSYDSAFDGGVRVLDRKSRDSYIIRGKFSRNWREYNFNGDIFWDGMQFKVDSSSTFHGEKKKFEVEKGFISILNNSETDDQFRLAKGSSLSLNNAKCRLGNMLINGTLKIINTNQINIKERSGGIRENAELLIEGTFNDQIMRLKVDSDSLELDTSFGARVRFSSGYIVSLSLNASLKVKSIIHVNGSRLNLGMNSQIDIKGGVMNVMDFTVDLAFSCSIVASAGSQAEDGKMNVQLAAVALASSSKIVVGPGSIGIAVIHGSLAMKEESSIHIHKEARLIVDGPELVLVKNSKLVISPMSRLHILFYAPNNQEFRLENSTLTARDENQVFFGESFFPSILAKNMELKFKGCQIYDNLKDAYPTAESLHIISELCEGEDVTLEAH